MYSPRKSFGLGFVAGMLAILLCGGLLGGALAARNAQSAEMERLQAEKAVQAAENARLNAK